MLDDNFFSGSSENWIDIEMYLEGKDLDVELLLIKGVLKVGGAVGLLWLLALLFCRF